MSSRLNAFLAISLLIHLLVMGLLYDPEVQRLLRRASPPPPPPAPSLTVLNHVPPPPPKQPEFVPTIPSQEVAKENPNAPLESERNTAIKSREAAKDPNSPLPTMAGVKNNGLNYLDTPSSPEVRSTPSQPTPAQKASPPAPAAKPTPPQPEQKPQPPQPQQPAPPNPQAAPNPVKDAPPSPSRQAPPQYPNAVPILPAPPDVTKPGEKPTPTPPTPNPGQAPQPTPNPQPDAKPEQKPQPPTPPQQATPPAPQTPPQEAQPPPSTHSFAQQRSEIPGGATPDVDDPSPEAKETEAGKYKAKLYKLIGSRWYLTVEQNMTLLQIGEVRVKFFVRANGVIDQISVSGASGRTDILETISLKSVEKSSGVMEPFSDSMKSQFGEGFWDEITFTIY